MSIAVAGLFAGRRGYWSRRGTPDERERPAAVLASFRRGSGDDWRNIGANHGWRTGRVQFGTGSDPCFPDDFAGLGVEAVTDRWSRLTERGYVADLVMVQDNTASNEIASRRVVIR